MHIGDQGEQLSMKHKNGVNFRDTGVEMDALEYLEVIRLLISTI